MSERVLSPGGSRAAFLDRLTRFFASRLGIIIAGAAIGILAPLLQNAGNPPNMGICVACFERDIAGALGLHRAGAVQYIRPEIIAFVLGSTLAALLFSEFKARSGPRHCSLVLGCLQIGHCVHGLPGARSATGRRYLNAILGLAGLTVGVSIGVWFLKQGYTLGRARSSTSVVGWIMPAIMAGLLLLVVFEPEFSDGGPIFFSESGPGSMRAALLASLGAGLIIGILAQRTRFCTMGSIRDMILMRDTHLISGVAALVVVAFGMNVILGQVDFGIEAQPIAHSNHLWNFLGMVLAGLAFALAGGCPGRQLILSG